MDDGVAHLGSIIAALCAAAFAYSCAYTARCGHALGKDERGEAGTFAYLVWTEREDLLAM